jgi:urea carboxylase
MSFDTVLIANRGAIATRIIRTLRRMGLKSVAVYSEADEGSNHVSEADEAVFIGPAKASESYLNIAAILDAAKKTGAGAIHPGYGFLAENVEFAEACAAVGIVFIGPTPDNIRTFGLKHSARALAAAHEVPLAPGTGLLTDEEEAVGAAVDVGYPVILKATAGGGGIGMKVCENEADLRDGFATVARLGLSNFGDASVFLERYVRRARHIEVQLFGDGEGRVMALGERDCSLQRRNQKVVEEAPAPLLPQHVRAELIASAVRLGEAARYRSAGTVEYLYDADREEFFFLEMNTRLQVEHGVTEEVMGIDLVEWMVRGGAGDFAFLDGPAPTPRGHSVQMRLYAEDPSLDYRRRIPRGYPRRDLVFIGQHGQRLVRSDAGQADRPCPDPRGSGGGGAGGDRPQPDRRYRDQCALAARCRPLARLHRRRGFDPGSGCHRLSPPLDPRGQRRHRNDRAGLAGAPEALGRWRAALGADGRPVVPPRQPSARQSGRHGGA